MTADAVLVDAFAGGGGFWLASLGEHLVPPVAWMGGKRRLARDLLALLGVAPGCRLPILLGDASWWGWVWPAVLSPETGPRVSEILRGWRGEDDPRALWFRLRDMGPVVDDVPAAAAQLLWLQARAASGVPVWWEGGDAGQGGISRLLAGSEGSEGSEGSRSANAKGVHGGPGRLVQHASTQIDEAGQRQATEPRLLAQSGPRTDGSRGTTIASMSGDKATLLASDGRGVPRVTGHRGRDSRAGGGIMDPGTVADRIDAIRRASTGVEVCVVHAEAGALTASWAPVLGSRALVYLDPPYAGRTGYPVACPRAEVLHIAETWARHGAKVVISEAIGLADELGPTWEEIRLCPGPKPEWVTVHGCDTWAVLPPLLKLVPKLAEPKGVPSIEQRGSR
jgi:hypothetical protein